MSQKRELGTLAGATGSKPLCPADRSTHQFKARTSNHRRSRIESDGAARPIRMTCQAHEGMESTIAARFRSIGVEGLSLRFGRGEIPDQEASVYRACGWMIDQLCEFFSRVGEEGERTGNDVAAIGRPRDFFRRQSCGGFHRAFVRSRNFSLQSSRDLFRRHCTTDSAGSAWASSPEGQLLTF